jgi:acyl-CoA thioester hydrolase
MGRCKFLEAVNFPIQIAIETGFIPIVVNMQIAYKKPLYLGEKVLLDIWLSELNKTTHVVEFRFYNSDGILAATGQQKGIFVNSKTMRPASLTADIRNLFIPYLDNAESA